MGFDDIIPVLWVILSILGLIFKDRKKGNKKEDKKDENKNKKHDPKELSYIEKFKEMGKSIKEEISFVVEESKLHDVHIEKSKDHEVRIKNNKMQADEKEREEKSPSQMHEKRKEMLKTEEIRDVINKNEIGKEGLYSIKKVL
jgi:hypothetical protein